MNIENIKNHLKLRSRVMGDTNIVLYYFLSESNGIQIKYEWSHNYGK